MHVTKTIHGYTIEDDRYQVSFNVDSVGYDADTDTVQALVHLGSAIDMLDLVTSVPGEVIDAFYDYLIEVTFRQDGVVEVW